MTGNFYIGTTPVQKLMLGSVMIWEKEVETGDVTLINGNEYLNLLERTYNDPVVNIDNDYSITSLQWGAILQPKRRFPLNGIIDVLFNETSISQQWGVYNSDDFFSTAQIKISINSSGIVNLWLYNTNSNISQQPEINQFIRLKNMGTNGDYTTVKLSYINYLEVETFSQDFEVYAIGASYNIIQFSIEQTSVAKISKPQGRGLTIIP